MQDHPACETDITTANLPVRGPRTRHLLDVTPQHPCWQNLQLRQGLSNWKRARQADSKHNQKFGEPCHGQSR